MKNDGVRSCLIELQSFLQSKIDVEPIHSVLMFFNVLCMQCARRGAPKSIVSGSLCFLSKRIHRQKEYCMSVAQILSSRYQP